MDIRVDWVAVAAAAAARSTKVSWRALAMTSRPDAWEAVAVERDTICASTASLLSLACIMPTFALHRRLTEHVCVCHTRTDMLPCYWTHSVTLSKGVFVLESQVGVSCDL